MPLQPKAIRFMKPKLATYEMFFSVEAKEIKLKLV